MYSNEHLRSDNNDADLKASGLTAAPSLRGIYDFNGGIGGPIVKNRVWFFHSTRRWGAANYIANQFFDNGDPAFDRSKLQAYTTRLTHSGQSQEQAVGDVRRAAESSGLLRERDRTADARTVRANRISSDSTTKRSGRRRSAASSSSKPVSRRTISVTT